MACVYLQFVLPVDFTALSFPNLLCAGPVGRILYNVYCSFDFNMCICWVFFVCIVQESDEKKGTSGYDDHSRTSETNSEPQENSDEEAIKISGRKRTTSTPGNLLSDSDENSLDRTVAYALQDIEEILEKPFDANPEESTQTDVILPSVRKRNMNNTITSDTDEEGDDSGSYTSGNDNKYVCRPVYL